MGDGGKSKTRSAKSRKGKARAEAKPSPAATAAKPEAAAAPPPDAGPGRAAGSAAAVEEPAAKAGGAGVALFIAAAVAVIAVAGYLTRSAWLPPGGGKKPAAVAGAPAAPAPAKETEKAAEAKAPSPAADSAAFDALAREREQLRAELDRMIARLDSVEKSMDTAKKMIRATEPPADRIAGGPSLQSLSERVDALERNDAALKDLMKRVDRMEKDTAAGGGGARATALAVAGLGDAVARGEPYQRHLETLKAVAGGDADVRAAATLLEKRAATGIPTLGDLRVRFDALAGQIVRAAKARADGGWMARAADRISSLITWRRVGGAATGDSVDAVVARVEARLAVGDLAGAVKALEGVAADKNAAAAAEPWLNDANARIVAERTVASLRVHAVSLLAPSKP